MEAATNSLQQGQESPLFQGALWISIFGALSGFGYYLLNLFYDWLTRKFIITIQLTNADESFDNVIRWLSEQETMEAAKVMKVAVKKQKNKRRWWQEDRNDAPPELEFLPGDGLHVFTYKNKWIWLNRFSDNQLSSKGWDNKPFQFQHLQFWCVGLDQQIFKDMMNEAMQSMHKKDHGKTRVFVLNEYGYDWTEAIAKDPRPVESVILDENLSEEILKDAQEFMGAAEWYKNAGIPYRRGYLLYGPPGCGKTSFVTALAGKLEMNICMLSLSSKSLDDQSLNFRLHDVPARSIVLLEDVDAVFVDRHAVKKEEASGVSFSGLLNALDGVASHEGSLFFMSTNHIEKLDPALIRPGRCDVRVKFELASRSQINRLFVRFFPEEISLGKQFADEIPEKTVSMAMLQGHLLKYKEDPKGAIESIPALLQMAEEAAKRKTSEFKGVRVRQWLRRLGLEMYADIFEDEEMTHVDDLKEIDDETLKSTFKIKSTGHRKRIMKMVNGDAEVRAEYAFVTKMQAREIFLHVFAESDSSGSSSSSSSSDQAGKKKKKKKNKNKNKNDDGGSSSQGGQKLQKQKSIASVHELESASSTEDMHVVLTGHELTDKFVEMIPPNSVSVCQLREFVFAHDGNPESAIRDLPQLLQHPKDLDELSMQLRAHRHRMSKEREIENYRPLSIEKFLKSVKLEQYLDKFVEQGLEDTDVLTEYTPDDCWEMMEGINMGAKVAFRKAFEEAKKAKPKKEEEGDE